MLDFFPRLRVVGGKILLGDEIGLEYATRGSRGVEIVIG